MRMMFRFRLFGPIWSVGGPRCGAKKENVQVEYTQFLLLFFFFFEYHIRKCKIAQIVQIFDEESILGKCGQLDGASFGCI